MPLELRTINAREAGRLVTQAIEAAQAVEANQGSPDTYLRLAMHASVILDLMRTLRTEARAVRDIWNADDLAMEWAAGTLSTQYATAEQTTEMIIGLAAFEQFLQTPLEVAPGITVTPDQIISRTKPPAPNWGQPAPAPPEE